MLSRIFAAPIVHFLYGSFSRFCFWLNFSVGCVLAGEGEILQVVIENREYTANSDVQLIGMIFQTRSMLSKWSFHNLLISSSLT